MGWLVLIDGTVCTPQVWHEDGFVLLADGKIQEVGPTHLLPDYIDLEKRVSARSSRDFSELQDGQYESIDVVDCKGRFVTPGLIDIHIHGALGYDIMDNDRAGFTQMSRGLLRFGTTSFAPTTVSAPIANVLEVMGTANEMQELAAVGAAEPLGFHVEGPFINPERKGAHDERFLKKPEIAELESLWEASGGFWRTLTLAPELEGALDAIKWLDDHGVVVSLGHSTADAETVGQAVNAGARHSTHLFNGMEPLHHRKPGLVGQILTDKRLTTEVIVDTFHIDPTVLRLAFAAKSSSQIALISDGMKAVGLADGQYDLGGLTVYVKDGACRLADGTLAGSSVTLDRSIRILVNTMGLGFQEAVTMATVTPARILGVDHRKGHLAPGMDADLSIWEKDTLAVEAVVARGNYYLTKEV